MIPIRFDLSDIVDEFQLSQKEADNMLTYVVREVTARIAYNWSQQAKLNLHKTRSIYMNSLVVGEEGKFTGYVMLVGKMPNMIEDGAGPFDIKEGFQKSKNAVRKANGGWYLTVPLRHATPGALAESEVFSDIMPSEIYSAVRKKEGQITQVGGTVENGKGLHLNDIPEEYRTPSVRPEIKLPSVSFEAYQHKHSIYEGMQKSEKQYESATQGSYVTFRRVSDNSDAMSWIHSGFTARNLAEKAVSVTNVPHEVDKASDVFLKQAGF